MKKFEHVNAATLDEAVLALTAGKARIIAGGTDLLPSLKDEILPDYPETLINIKSVPGMAFIEEEAGVLRIGAATLLCDVALAKIVRERYQALAEASGRVGHPHIREMGTLGGNICQLTRCWYFRVPANRFFCRRKGGDTCYALTGDGRYHSIFGGVAGCVAINPSDVAPALVALGAQIKTTRRVVEAESFFSAKGCASTVLDENEIVSEVRIPAPASGTKSAFIKYALRKSIDFPIVNCAAAIGPKEARICLNAVFNNPYRAAAAEEVILGKPIDEAIADAAGAAAVSAARPLKSNRYKVQIARTLVKRAILACR
ncbi:MAG: FAD binding domain-containing protein [Syntrophorhabdales bacterium]|jgi:xanthine dehydrogenase YagS FAD-binding subunit